MARRDPDEGGRPPRPGPSNLEPVPTFAHAGRIALTAVVVLAGSAVVAGRHAVPSWELRLTTWINGWPSEAAHAMYPVMQLGTVAAPLVAALVILVASRDVRLALATAVGGVVAWFVAKLVKQLVQRGRPLKYLPNVVVREGSGTGLGFVSGHATVAAATAVMVIAALPRRARRLGGAVAIALAVVVGVGRIVHGVHLPIDVTGGWALGTLLGVGAVELVDRSRAQEGARERAL